ncbi:MAG: glycosyltransferase family 4 protein [Chloroflexi bacterium]|nr:glycosyltransferase family 4 protein [Chloroflexota bacterium]
MKILHACFGQIPRINAVNGGQLRYWQDLNALATLGHDVHLVLLFGGTEDDLEPEVRETTSSIISLRRGHWEPTYLNLLKAMLSPSAAMSYYTKTHSSHKKTFDHVVSALKPDLIWAASFGGIFFANSFNPVVYSHSDFYFKILNIRAQAKKRKLKLRDYLTHIQLKRSEFQMCRAANAVVCASASDRDFIQQHLNINTTYIPIVGPTLHQPQNGDVSSGRIFLFGNSGNSALFYAREHLRNELWPLLEPALPEVEWHQVGLIMPHHEDRPDIQWLQQNFDGIHGFVEDLGTVFCSGDISLVPYTEDTGFRTKFVTAASYGVINIGYRATFECAPEFEHGKNCLIADSPAELVKLLQDVTQNAEWRASLAAGARQLYEERFSFESQLPLYQRVLESI